MLTLCKDNISVICKDLVFWVKKTSSTKKFHFLKLPFSLLIFSDENNITKLDVECVSKLFQQIVSVIVQLNLNEHDFQMLCKICVFKNFAKFT